MFAETVDVEPVSTGIGLVRTPERALLLSRSPEDQQKLITGTDINSPGLKLISVKLPEALIEGMDELVRRGLYPSRSAILRAAVRDLLRRELWGEEGKAEE